MQTGTVTIEIHCSTPLSIFEGALFKSAINILVQPDLTIQQVIKQNQIHKRESQYSFLSSKLTIYSKAVINVSVIVP